MIELLLEWIVYFFVEILFEGTILGFFRVSKLIGIVILKLVTLSNQPMVELEDKYKDSSKPYFLGFGMTIGIIYLIINFIN